MQQHDLPSADALREGALADEWSWRHAATVLLLLVCVPVFLVAALVASVVAVPVLLFVAAGRAADAVFAQPPQRRVF